MSKTFTCCKGVSIKSVIGIIIYHKLQSKPKQVLYFLKNSNSITELFNSLIFGSAHCFVRYVVIILIALIDFPCKLYH